MTSRRDIIARLERSPAAWVCIRREAADEIRELRAERDQWIATAVDLDRQCAEWCDKINAVKSTLHHHAASDGLLAPLAAAVLREIEEIE
jgi:hypothetical protein